MAAMSGVKRATASFTEEKRLKILDRPLTSRGRLVYLAPDHVEKITTEPKVESLIVDKEKLTIEQEVRPFRRTLSLRDNPEIAAFVESIRGTLAGDATLLQRFYTVKLDGTAADWRLSLAPRAAEMKAMVDAVVIAGSGTEVRRIEIDEAGGDRSIMTVAQDPL